MNVSRQHSYKLYSSSFFQVLAGFITRAIVLAQQIIIAKNYGLSWYADSFFAIYFLPQIIADAFPAAITQAFTPISTRLQVEDIEKYQDFVRSVIGLLILLFLIIALIPLAYPSLALTILIPGMTDGAENQTTNLLRIVTLSLPLLGLGGFAIGFLQAQTEFRIPIVAQIVGRLTLLIGVLAAVNESHYLWLGWSILFAAIVRLIILLPAFWKRMPVWPLFHLNDENSKLLIRRLLPVLTVQLSVYINLMVDRFWISWSGTGNITALNFASTLGLLFSGLVAVPISVVLLPFLAKERVAKNDKRYQAYYRAIIDLTVLIILPLIALLLFFSKELIALLFMRGNFDLDAVLQTNEFLVFYSIGVFALSLQNILSSVFYSKEDIKIPVKAAFLGIVGNLILSPMMMYFWGRSGVVLATSISFIGGFFYLTQQFQTDKNLDLNFSSRVREFFKGIVAVTILLIALRLLYSFVTVKNGSVQILEQIVVLSSLGVFAYLISLYVLRSRYVLVGVQGFKHRLVTKRKNYHESHIINK